MTPENLIGRLRIRPGAPQPVVCERPMVAQALLDRVTGDRRAALLPDLLATLFTMCAHAQRSTARRAVLAALGLADPAADAARDGLAIGLHVAREHLQRLAIDLPSLAPVDGLATDPGWLRDAPVMGLPAAPTAYDLGALQAAASALPGWLGRRLFGGSAADWLAGWEAEGGDWLARWCRSSAHPAARWLAAVRADAERTEWPCVPFDPLSAGEQAMREFAVEVDTLTGFAERPLWHGAPAETGTWTRVAGDDPVRNAWQRLGSRLADLARIAGGHLPAIGALRLADGEGIAWTEMSRGLLMHWVRLADGERDPATARAQRYRVIAPTEWNFHPDGAFARLVGSGRLDAAQLRLAAATLDPCVGFSIGAEHPG